MPKKNKVKFNICNVHYALQTFAEDGTVFFGTPVAMPGGCSFPGLDANGEPSNFYAYYTISNNMGYDGDVKKIRHVLYNCAASRPSIESSTNEDEIEVQTETFALTATLLANGYVKAKTGDVTTEAVYQGWYSAVYLPTAEEEPPAKPAVLSASSNAKASTSAKTAAVKEG